MQDPLVQGGDLSAEERARRVKVIVFDVDGVLTDGTLWFIPTGKQADGSPTAVETKGFSAHDGLGMAIGRAAGLRFGVITKRNSETVAVRMRDLRVEFLFQGQHHKMEAVHQIVEQAGVSLDEIAYVGDDIIDLPVMRRVGFAVAVWNAREQVKAASHWVTTHSGGHGAGRDVIDFVLAARGELDEAIERYLADAGSPADIGVGGM